MRIRGDAAVDLNSGLLEPFPQFFHTLFRGNDEAVSASGGWYDSSALIRPAWAMLRITGQHIRTLAFNSPGWR